MAGLVRCPSIPTIRTARAASLSAPRRASSFATPGRSASLECCASLRPDEGWNDWDLDAAMMPWPTSSSLSVPPNQAEDTSAPSGFTFYPPSQPVDLNFRAPTAPVPDSAQPAAPRDGTCHVILFGVGQEHTEGIYTLRTQDFAEGDYINVDTVVAFEAADDAERFSTLLEASLSYQPTVFPISWADITEWCSENNTRCRLEPAGSLLIPPDSNVGVTDWERLLSLKRGQYQVLEDEPTLAEADGMAPGFFIDGPDWVHEEAASFDNLGNIVDSRLADASISSIRDDLERLINQ